MGIEKKLQGIEGDKVEIRIGESIWFQNEGEG
jgi:hypothetical protein